MNKRLFKEKGVKMDSLLEGDKRYRGIEGSRDSLLEGWKTRGQEGWPFKRDRGIEGLRESLLTLISQPSSHPYLHTSKRPAAFTMSEILISLTIIGIIAAITLPSLIGNINEKTFAAKRKALHARMTQAISMMPSLNGYGVGENDTQTAQNATQAFITNGLSKVLKISNICDNENFKKCGFPDKFTKMGKGAPKMDSPKKITDLNGYFSKSNANVDYSQLDTNSAAFETANGESVLTFYNPNCSYTYGVNGKNGSQTLMQPTMCANFIYDLNGRKGPNKVGKDIGFMTVFYPTDSEVTAPMPAGSLVLYKDDAHPQFTIGYGNATCRQKYGDEAKMANIEEMKSIFVNNKLGYSNFILNDDYFSSTMPNENRIYRLSGYTGSVVGGNLNFIASSYGNIFCVKR